MWIFLQTMLKSTINLRAFGECLNNLKYVQFWGYQKTQCQQELCIEKHSNNIMRWH
jgi:hypothetical protein